MSLDFTEEDLDVSHLRSGRVIQRGRGQKRVSDADTEEDELGATRARRRTRKAKVGLPASPAQPETEWSFT